MIVLLICLALSISGVLNKDMDGDDDYFKCLEDGSWIAAYKRCDGEINCPNGSDESFVECKEYLNVSEVVDPSEESFVCANGVLPFDSNAKSCNDNIQCSDGSDELIIGCVDNPNQFIRGKCLSSYMECHSGACIPESKMCNGHVDCVDGRDESLELCFDSKCKYPSFQCGNGFCIDPIKLCDNKFDCIDGSDEIPGVCEKICTYSNDHVMCEKFKGWNRTEPARCIEPIEEHIEFMNTTFHKIENEKFVYANGVVQFKCKGQKDVNENEKWNVCLNTGEWRNPLPTCKKMNTNAATNGSLGCPLNYYDEDKMKISQCENARCKSVKLPLNDMRVKIECNHGYSLDFEGTNSRKNSVFQVCYNKTWINSKEPKCIKFCNGRQVSNLYALDLECKECLDNEKVKPGLTANFTCSSRFHYVKEEALPELECLENGKWQGLDNLVNEQHELCTYNCMNKYVSGTLLSKNGIPADSTEAPWTTAIYDQYNKTLCTGTLIRLDLVLTAAHCLRSNISKTDFVDKNQIFVRYLQTYNGNEPTTSLGVQRYKVHNKYGLRDHSFDVAILFLKKKVTTPVGQGIICLPWLKTANFEYEKNKSEGYINTWNGGNQTLSVVSFSDLQNSEHAELFHIKAKADLCTGDSGSPVVVSCKSNGWSGKCLIGLVTRLSSSNNICSDNIAVVNINYFLVSNFIKQNEDYFPNQIY